MINLNAEIRLPVGIERRLAKFAFGSKARERCWRKLASHQRHRMPIDESLRLFTKQAHSAKSLAEHCYVEIRNRLSSGKSMNEALAGFASSEEILLIYSSQLGGRLSDGLLLAAELLAAKRKISGAVLGALAYPLLLLGVLIAVLYTIAVVVIPELTAITDPTRWQGPAARLYQISCFVDSPYGFTTLVAVLAGIAILLLTLPRWTGLGRRLADHIPPWSIYKMLVGVSWLHTVATLMVAGQKLVDIVGSMLSDRTTTPYLRSILRKINVHAARGASLGDTLEKTGLRWPSAQLVEELQAYSSLPGFGEELRSIANDWLEEGIGMIVRAARSLNVICILAVGGLVILMVTGLSSIQQQIASGLGV